MKLSRLPYQTSALVEFFEEGLPAIGAVCERAWHDRIHVIAEGTAAKLWNADGAFTETEIQFDAPGESRPRDAAREVFPGCPLTFHLAEALRPATLPLEKIVLQISDSSRPPSTELARKLWQTQFPKETHWEMITPLLPSFAFSLTCLVRAEIQAIEQHWSLHRMAVSLPEGTRDDNLAASLDFAQAQTAPTCHFTWPKADLPAWQNFLCRALEEELQEDLAVIRNRQQNYLRRELQRIDSYFATYQSELVSRKKSGSGQIKLEERLAAAKTEHARRRQDQVQRHEIRVIAHPDALLLVAEPAWETTIRAATHQTSSEYRAQFNSRTRYWRRSPVSH